MARKKIIRPSKEQNEKIGKQADKALANGTYFDMDEIFPAMATELQSDGTVSLHKELHNRARRVSVHGKEYQKEYVLYVLNELKLKNIPHDAIAHMFRVSVRTIQNWVKDLEKEYSRAAKEIDPYVYVGRTLATYSMLREKGLQLVADGETPPKEMILAIAALNKTLEGEARFMEKVGFLGRVDIRPTEEATPEDVTFYKRMQGITAVLMDDTIEIPMEEDEILTEG